MSGVGEGSVIAAESKTKLAPAEIRAAGSDSTILNMAANCARRLFHSRQCRLFLTTEAIRLVSDERTTEDQSDQERVALRSEKGSGEFASLRASLWQFQWL